MSTNSLHNINQFIDPSSLGEVSSVDAIAGKISLDPESLKLLEEKSALNDVDFEKVLNGAKNGQDPDAIIELLMKSQSGEKNNVEQPKLLQLAPKSSPQNISQGPQNFQIKNHEIAEIETNPAVKVKNNELKSILNDRPVVDSNVKQSVHMKEMADSSSDVEALGDETLLDTIPKHENKRASNPLKKTSLSDILGKTASSDSRLAGNESLVKDSSISAEPMHRVPQLQKSGTPVKSEQIVDFNQFIANQSPSTQKMMQKQLVKNAYRPISQSMFDKKITESLPGVISKPSDLHKTTSLKDIIFSDHKAASTHELAAGQEVIAASEISNDISKNKNNISEPTKVFKLSSVQSVNTPDELISKVQDYIIQSRVGNKAEVQMAFHHTELGQVDLIVNKTDNAVNVAINPHTAQGKDFFSGHQTELVRHLNQAGVPVGDFKVEMPQFSASLNSFSQSLSQSPLQSANQSSTQSESSFSKQGQQEFSEFNQQRGNHNSESGQRDQDARRREALWQNYHEKEVA